MASDFGSDHFLQKKNKKTLRLLMSKVLIFIVGILCLFFVLNFPAFKDLFNGKAEISPVPKSSVDVKNTPTNIPVTPVPTEIPIDYLKYSFEALSEKSYGLNEIKIGRMYKKSSNFTAYIFTYKSEEKTISGLANIPNGKGKFPVIVLLHGWADKEAYYPGYGTEKSANFFAENGFLTLAPDFTGYGTSDWENPDILAARFERPIEVLNLLSGIGSLAKADSGKIGIWGHSNGGQIALSVLEITGKNYPCSLWAPVSLDFPECVLTYLGTEEVGNIVKEKIDSFLILNDPKKFSVRPYISKLKSNFIIHQGMADSDINPQWTQSLLDELKNAGLSVEYFTYPKENHNFNRYKTTGEVLRQRDLEFFTKQLKVQN